MLPVSWVSTRCTRRQWHRDIVISSSLFICKVRLAVFCEAFPSYDREGDVPVRDRCVAQWQWQWHVLTLYLCVGCLQPWHYQTHCHCASTARRLCIIIIMRCTHWQTVTLYCTWPLVHSDGRTCGRAIRLCWQHGLAFFKIWIAFCPYLALFWTFLTGLWQAIWLILYLFNLTVCQCGYNVEIMWEGSHDVIDSELEIRCENQGVWS